MGGRGGERERCNGLREGNLTDAVWNLCVVKSEAGASL